MLKAGSFVGFTMRLKYSAAMQASALDSSHTRLTRLSGQDSSHPILPAALQHYVDLERAGPDVTDAQHIYNKALFDAANEALTELLPPHSPR